MKKSMSWRIGGILVLAVLCSSVRAEDGWRHTMGIYMVGASIDGTVGVGPVEGDIDVSFGDILDNLDIGGMAAYHGERGPWYIGADFMYLGLEKKKSGIGPTGNAQSKVEVDQLLFEVDGGYALTEQLDVYGGLRYWDLESKVSLVGGGPLGQAVTAKVSESWVDPVVGLRYVVPLSERWRLVTRGDIGGFGLGSDFSWHVTAFFGWELVDNVMAMFGIRYIDVDYDDGSGSERFLFDVTLGGPAAGIAWSF
jgi:hypothetical protein